ncbi:aminotransferase class I/II-fold pyridoxal phosphate-dependent enzyme [Maribacter aestuarii]|uniref:aminotransferase class I/II-fold pyridoxal phosphate-dependent enzyme n=1 Tax=Maribacter aestuarii TaxID=1130723 RepID=UPI00248BCAEA|nr:8-amino-7-oxononanoate synthase [Maribacter aestuarii]
MLDFPKRLKQKLEERVKEDSLRVLDYEQGLVDFTSNDYLGLAKDETLFSKTFQLLLTKNIAENGATGSRLLTGNHSLYETLESLLSSFHMAESALVFNSGYDANIGFFSSVPLRGDLIFYDELVHASIRDGMAMSNAKSYKFPHNDITGLQEKISAVLKGSKPEKDAEIYIVTESVFSMDGDSPDLKALAQFCTNNKYRLIVDEAHAVGIFGKNGEGLVQELKLQGNVFARIVTFGKALGAHGAAILGPSSLTAYLLNFARSFIYSTGLSPHCIATVISSYEYLKDDSQEERQRLKRNINFFKEKAVKLNLQEHFVVSNSAIHSYIISDNTRVKSVSKKLKDKGFNVKAILYPTVPLGQERLRFCIHSTNSEEEIGLVLELLSNYL